MKQRTAIVLNMLLRGASRSEILTFAADNWHIKRSTTDSLIRRANDIVEKKTEAQYNRKINKTIERVKKVEQKRTPRNNSIKRSPRGYVYLLKEINGTNYKIGRTSNPKSRKATFDVKLPYRVKFVVVIQTKNMYALEAELHAHFADKRVNGEWFALLPEDIEYIKGTPARQSLKELREKTLEFVENTQARFRELKQASDLLKSQTHIQHSMF